MAEMNPSVDDVKTKEKILQAAECFFTEKGYQASSTREIAQKAGCNVALISYYFGNKENLLNEIYKRHAQQMRDRLLPFASKAKITEDLIQLMDQIFSKIDNDAGIFRNTAWAAVEHGPMLDAMAEHLWKPFFEIFSTIVVRATSKTLSPVDLKARCLLLSGLVHQYSSLRWHSIGKLGLSEKSEADVLLTFRSLALNEVTRALL